MDRYHKAEHSRKRHEIIPKAEGNSNSKLSYVGSAQESTPKDDSQLREMTLHPKVTNGLISTKLHDQSAASYHSVGDTVHEKFESKISNKPEDAEGSKRGTGIVGDGKISPAAVKQSTEKSAGSELGSSTLRRVYKAVERRLNLPRVQRPGNPRLTSSASSEELSTYASNVTITSNAAANTSASETGVRGLLGQYTFVTSM